ncbi:lysoplasmalogenase [Streptomyces pseudovenezuelae]|uniref:Lysoplasmalogenase n=1 Tax=Streptomyces pseudovenezuelae TaxID=67350 RepID=A0ABZ1XA33_9ACTN|nr:lysoplasmalogenase [Streptomyces pseudovenezuelae]
MPSTHGTRHALLTVFALTAAVDLTSLAVGFAPGHTVAKPLLMPLLAAYCVTSGAPRLLVGALLCGWGGDVLLLSDADPAFLVGMASFAAGHVCYLALFQAYGSPRVRAGLLAPAYATALVVTVVALWPDLPAGLRVPVAGYSVLLTTMACASAVRFGALTGLGGALFLLSDTLIATGVADWPQLPRPEFWIMLTYVAAQFLLASGTTRALEARPGPMATYGEVRSTERATKRPTKRPTPRSTTP